VTFAAKAKAKAKPRADAAEQAYEKARTAHHALKKDSARRRFRHHWLNVAKVFEQVAAKYPRSQRGADALFTAAELYSDLSRLSQVDRDLDAAVRAYQRVIDSYPKNRLADDAALALAQLRLLRQGEVEAARQTLEKALRADPKRKGDKHRELKQLLATLPKSKARVAKAPPVDRRRSDDRRPARAARDDERQSDRRPSRSARWAPASRDDEVASAHARPVPAKGSGSRSLASAFARVATGDGADEGAVEEDDEGASPLDALALPTLAEVQEKLRDVRVGEDSHDEKVDSRLARSRLKKMAAVEREADLTLAQQLGLKVRRVVIDPGHGGHDTGAIGRAGTREKDIALAISKKLKAELTRAGLEVVMTRDDDTFVKLEDRTRFANRNKGDLFISIHCNSAPSRSLRGVETYTLNTSADRYSIRLAARENAASEKGISDLQLILADLATKANTEESTRLAKRVQGEIVSSLKSRYGGVKDLGTKEALFFVLLGAKMPAILVETSFLSNAEEERLLRSDAYQQELASAIADGVHEFLGERRRLAQVQ
jgi:N-acetylmuramoyl-L-alanine amidase